MTLQVDVLGSSCTVKQDLEIAQFLKNCDRESNSGLIQDRFRGYFAASPFESARQLAIVLRSKGAIVGLLGVKLFEIAESQKSEEQHHAYKFALLSDLRISKRCNKLPVLHRGWKALTSVLQSNNIADTYAFVLERNKEFMSSLCSLRHYVQSELCSTYITLICPVRKLRSELSYVPSRKVSVRWATIDDMSVLIDFLKQDGLSKNGFIDVPTDQDLSSVSAFRGLKIHDFLLAFTEERLVGSLALWKQTDFRRWCLPSGFCKNLMGRILCYAMPWSKMASLAGGKRSYLDLRYLTYLKVDDEAVLESLMRYLVSGGRHDLGDLMVLGGESSRSEMSFFATNAGWQLRSKMFRLRFKCGVDFDINAPRPTFEIGAL